MKEGHYAQKLKDKRSWQAGALLGGTGFGVGSASEDRTEVALENNPSDQDRLGTYCGRARIIDEEELAKDQRTYRQFTRSRTLDLHKGAKTNADSKPAKWDPNAESRAQAW